MPLDPWLYRQDTGWSVRLGRQPIGGGKWETIKVEKVKTDVGFMRWHLPTGIPLDIAWKGKGLTRAMVVSHSGELVATVPDRRGTDDSILGLSHPLAIVSFAVPDAEILPFLLWAVGCIRASRV